MTSDLRNFLACHLIELRIHHTIFLIALYFNWAGLTSNFDKFHSAVHGAIHDW